MRILIYGAYGYTGELVTRHATAAGLDVLLAGRRAEPLAALAESVGAEACTIALDDDAALDAALDRCDVVIHCAGPFIRTSDPMRRACLRRGRSYVDITGEIEVFEAAAADDEAARAAGIVLLPGAGFDVVPTDTLAVHVAGQVPDAERLEIAFQGLSGVSRGTATTAVENLGRGGAVRREGEIRRVPAAWRTREVDFGRGPRTVVTIPWGDVATAWRSTGVPSITVYARLPAATRRLIRLSRYLAPLLSSRFVQRVLKTVIAQSAPGPDAHARASGHALVWARAEAPDGRAAEAVMQTPEPYRFTAIAAVEAAARIARGEVAPGYHTPATAFGPDFALGLGCQRRDRLAAA